jgi:plastocyanin
MRYGLIATTTLSLIALIAGCANNSSTGTAAAPPPTSGSAQTVTAVGSSACTGGGTYGSSTCTYYFTPTPDSVATGSTVSFAFQDVAHQVTFDTPGAPANLAAEMNTTVPVVFPTAGTYQYHCAIHPYMTGSITVH